MLDSSQDMNSDGFVETDVPVDFQIEKYANFRILGFTPRQAALQAGYRSHADYMKFENDPYVVETLKNHVAEVTREAKWTRDEVLGVVERAVDIAEITADPTAMLRGAQEINKMQGYYAEETKHVKLDVDVNIRQKQISEMSEAELLEALGKEQPYIDAEFEELPELPENGLPNKTAERT